MSYEFYKVLHLFGIALILLPLGAVLQHGLTGGTKTDLPNRKPLFIAHGTGMLLVFVAGFGLIARLGVGFPIWIWLKIGVWIIFGAAVGVGLRKPQLSRALLFGLPVLVGIAAYLARYKPF